MKRFSFSWIVLSGALLAPAVGFAQQISCVRGGLQRAVNLYIEAQTKGDTSGLPLAAGLGYVENMAPTAIVEGLINTPLKIDHHRSLLDESTCQTFTEVIVTDAAKPYILGTRLRVNHDKIAEIEILWTTTGYWLFNADNYLKYSSTEELGARFRPKSAIRGTRWSRPPTPTSMRFSKGRSTRCRGVSPVFASKAACTPAKALPTTAARSASRAA